MYIFGITGWKNSGKTGLVVRLVEHFTAQGRKVATIKHAHHDFDIDVPGTDSYRHRKAGATEVVVVSNRRWAMIHETEAENEPALQELLAKFSAADIVLIEGYKVEGHPKIQVIRPSEKKSNRPMPDNIPGIVAFATDQPIKATDYGRDCPVLELNDTGQIAEFIWQHVSREDS